jgi:hypothetical protein
MAWTSPRTWAAAETVTAALLNTHVRDNQKAIGDAWTAWTPTVTAETGTFTSASASGQYISAGKLVIWRCVVTVTTVGTAANGLRFTLPVTCISSGTYIGNGRASGGTQAQVTANTGTTAQAVRYDNASIIATGTHAFSGTYEAA